MEALVSAHFFNIRLKQSPVKQASESFSRTIYEKNREQVVGANEKIVYICCIMKTLSHITITILARQRDNVAVIQPVRDRYASA